MITLFKQKSPANIILLLILGLLIKMPLFLYVKNIEATAQDGKLYHYLLAFLSGNGPNGFACAVVSFCLLYSQALLLNYMINEYRMTSKQTYLPAMSYLLITSLLPEWNYLSAPLVASTLILWAFVRLFRLYNTPKANSAVFNLGMITGISSFLYFPSIALVLSILFGLIVLRPFRINDFVLLLLGVLTPYYFDAVYLYLTDRLVLSQFIPVITLQVPVIQSTLWLIIAGVLLVVPFLLGGYYVQAYQVKMLIQVRKYWGILLVYALVAILLPLLSSTYFKNWVLSVAPIAAFHASAYLYPQQKKIPLIIFLVTLAFILLQQYGTPMWQ